MVKKTFLWIDLRNFCFSNIGLGHPSTKKNNQVDGYIPYEKGTHGRISQIGDFFKFSKICEILFSNQQLEKIPTGTNT